RSAGRRGACRGGGRTPPAPGSADEPVPRPSRAWSRADSGPDGTAIGDGEGAARPRRPGTVRAGAIDRVGVEATGMGAPAGGSAMARGAVSPAARADRAPGVLVPGVPLAPPVGAVTLVVAV